MKQVTMISCLLLPLLGGSALATGCYYYLLHLLNPSSAVGSMFYMSIGALTLLLCYWDEVNRRVSLLLIPLLPAAKDELATQRYLNTALTPYLIGLH